MWRSSNLSREPASQLWLADEHPGPAQSLGLEGLRMAAVSAKLIALTIIAELELCNYEISEGDAGEGFGEARDW